MHLKERVVHAGISISPFAASAGDLAIILNLCYEPVV
jgi:hypothetical protein